MSATTSLKRRRARTDLNPRRAERIAAKFRMQPAQLTMDEARKIWERAEAFDVPRRAYLATLTKSGAELIEAAKIADAGESVAKAAVGAENYATKLREMADFMDTAHVRLMLALCEREDMDQLVESARAAERGS